MNKNNYCVIMAGGIGSRFWPMSRVNKPKQFLDILGTGHTLIQETFNRFKKICLPENILIVTSQEHKAMVMQQLPELAPENILEEPLRRNTAPCIDYANFKILKKNPNANVIVAPSDHLITMEDAFIDTLEKAIGFAENNDALVTLGIKPNRPETGYGYIQIDKKVSSQKNLFKVKTFTEKPDVKLAKVFLDSGEFLWNSGIFIWSLSSIMNAFTNHLPEVHTLFRSIEDKFDTAEEKQLIPEIYSSCKSISIDYGVMEKAKNVFVLSADFGWSDLGTWSSMYEHSEKDQGNNATNSEHILFYDSKHNLVNVSKDKLVILQGLEDFILVETNDVLLVCKKDQEQRIKQFINDLDLKFSDKL